MNDTGKIVSVAARNHLVVGYNGTIGFALFDRLQSENAAVFGTTQRTKNTEAPNIFYLNLSEEPDSWNLPKIKFDIVYLCAGISRMSTCENDPAGTRKVNVEGIKALVRKFNQTGSFIIYLSTNQVFSGEEPCVPVTATTNPLNEYGRQKAEIEHFIQTEGSSWAIVRLSKVIEQNMCLLKNWIASWNLNQPIDAFHDMLLAPISLRQVVDILLTIGKASQPGFYQISGIQDISFYEFASYIAKYLRQPQALVRPVSALETGIINIFIPRHTTLDCSSTIALCGQKPPLFSEVVNEIYASTTIQA